VKLSIIRIYVLTLVGITTVVLLALGLSSTPVKADDIYHSAKFQFVQQAELVSATTVNVTVRYSCLPSNPGRIRVELDQDGSVGLGSDFNAICDGANHTTDVEVTGGPSFGPGSAAVVGTIENATSTSVAGVSDEINLK